MSHCPRPRIEMKSTQAAKHSPLHQLRKRRHIGPKCRESLPPKQKRKLVGIWRVAGSPLLQTKTLRAIPFSKSSNSHLSMLISVSNIIHNRYYLVLVTHIAHYLLLLPSITRNFHDLIHVTVDGPAHTRTCWI